MPNISSFRNTPGGFNLKEPNGILSYLATYKITFKLKKTFK